MTHSLQIFAYTALITLVTLSIVLLSTVTFAQAATYAYVDATGEVKSVEASNWMSAIAIAPNIHMHSGVLLLKSAADFTIIGDDVSSVK